MSYHSLPHGLRDHIFEGHRDGVQCRCGVLYADWFEERWGRPLEDGALGSLPGRRPEATDR